MIFSYNIYQSQYKKATETLAVLIIERDQIEKDLKDNPIKTELHKALRTINMDIKITTNEIEFIEYNIQKLKDEKE